MNKLSNFEHNIITGRGRKLLAGLALTAAVLPVGSCASAEAVPSNRAIEHINVDQGPNLVIGDSLTFEIAQVKAGRPYDIPQEAAFKPGATSTDIWHMLVKRNLLGNNYQAAVIEIGTNDALPTDMISTITTDGYTERDHENITDLYNNVAEISKCVVAVPPSYNRDLIDTAWYGDGLRQRVELDKARTDLLENIVPDLQKRGVHVEIADPQDFIQDADATSRDGVHARPIFGDAPPNVGKVAIQVRSDVVIDALAKC